MLRAALCRACERLKFAAAIALLLPAAVLPCLVGRAWASDPDALWSIVDGQCVPDQQQNGNPAPCAEVDLRGGSARGYAILKDMRGATQFLLIPTARLSGIESPLIRSAGAPNYFADAWRARRFVEAATRGHLQRDDISLAINSVWARSQTQLHIHIDCVDAGVRQALRRYAAAIGRRWAPFPVALRGHRYWAMRVPGAELGRSNPFALLAEGLRGAREDMGRHTLVVVGAEFGKRPGFVLLTDHVDLLAGDLASGESLQDHACAARFAAPPQ